MNRAPSLRACRVLLASALLATVPAFAAPAVVAPAKIQVSPAIDAAVKSPTRDPANVKRDGFRHPAQSLAFFGVAPEKTVIEITPGGGWYSEILGPLLQAKGHYIAAVVDPQAVPEGRGRDYQQRSRDSLEKKFAAAPAQFGKTTVVAYDPARPVFGPANSADVVLTFRNVHNWRKAGQAQGMFQGFFNVLKPGGVLGVVEHRAKADVAEDDDTGYVGQQQVIAMAKAAGFQLAASTEVNANPRDTKDYPNGVWTLPPTNQHDAADAARYQAIGESDRMTLRFVKP
ncbi:methyltransferase [Stenotrophomonas sp. 24(2023)]|uniref:class I SAM-dependent methyltransferase n=1 Tax=Stenotrophomonas sp. 24(2023) TaxID=3068324 RepID=UPI0027DF0BA5|nr:methyltransferase [Stenotrophomonas sp. 24(2023)]WMJ70954.1 methyltransferase [Stenotrophomonas sp. 24(2023)]